MTSVKFSPTCCGVLVCVGFDLYSVSSMRKQTQGRGRHLLVLVYKQSAPDFVMWIMTSDPRGSALTRGIKMPRICIINLLGRTCHQRWYQRMIRRDSFLKSRLAKRDLQPTTTSCSLCWVNLI